MIDSWLLFSISSLGFKYHLLVQLLHVKNLLVLSIAITLFTFFIQDFYYGLKSLTLMFRRLKYLVDFYFFVVWKNHLPILHHYYCVKTFKALKWSLAHWAFLLNNCFVLSHLVIRLRLLSYWVITLSNPS